MDLPRGTTDGSIGSEEQFRSFFESMDQGYILTDVILDEHGVPVDLLYIEANSAAVRMTGTELVGRRTRELSPEFEGHWFETFGRVAATGVGERHELAAEPLGVWYDVYVFKVGAPETRRVAAVYQDVTRRKQADAALRASEDQLRRGLVTIQEDERRRIARDIHDQLGQQMTALRLNLEGLRLRIGAYPALSEQVGRARELTEELDRSIDFLTWELRPAVLEQVGLSAALADLVSSWSQRHHIAANYQAHGAAGLQFPSEVKTNIYRLAQEALHNVYKHAAASRVSVSLAHLDGRGVLEIHDDGRGFDQATLPSQAARRGLGLMSMRERSALVGGELQVESVAGRGTTIRLQMPLALGAQI